MLPLFPMLIPSLYATTQPSITSIHNGNITTTAAGHPMTSGFPRSIMNYYISWAAAELPLEQSQKHYTEVPCRARRLCLPSRMRSATM